MQSLDECCLNPFKDFQRLYICHDKERECSPTHDEGGFELDWEKVDDWIKPKSYNKSKMICGMANAVNRRRAIDL
jgi:hypothetical protein